jgi:ABC-type branched-subunit amino acid transport system ATPase component
VRENVILGLAYRYRAPLVSEFFDLPPSRAQRRAAAEEADRILAACGLETVANTFVSELPYGIQKTVELARALAGHPKLLLLDEPAAGMNPEETAASPMRSAAFATRTASLFFLSSTTCAW